jgi:hypothetical protein
MKYEIKIVWYPSENSKAIDQVIGFCNEKQKAYRIVVSIVKIFSNYQTIDYNCIELRKSKHSRIFGKIAIVEHLDRMEVRYGPFYEHLLKLGKPKTMSK